MAKRTLEQLIREDGFTTLSGGPVLISPMAPLSGQRGYPTVNPLSPVTGRGAMPAPTTYNASSGGGINWEGVGNAVCNLIPNANARLACMGLATALPNGGGSSTPGRGSTTPTTPLATPGPTNCPEGYVSDGAGGCRIRGLGSYLPGDVGMPDTGWTPMAGRYGVGVSPLPVQRTVRACPAGFVLGKDGVCYDHLAKTNREHNPGRKPLLTGGDMNALARARRLQKTIGKINTRFGPKKRHTHASHHPARKK